MPAQINISEVRKPELDGKLVADSITSQLERRVMFRRAMKRAVQNAMRLGAKGIKVEVSVVWAALKSRVPNGTVKVVCPCTPCAPTSTTQLLKPTPLRCDRR